LAFEANSEIYVDFIKSCGQKANFSVKDHYSGPTFDNLSQCQI